MLIDSEFDIRTALLTHKNLSPLTPIEEDRLKKIQSLDVHGFSEADVREEIITPILEILGYRKGQYSSLDREKHLKFFDDNKRKQKDKFIDYSATLWKESFWILEAKKPLCKDSFSFEHFQQALIYAVHPEINAAIIVLCDGVIVSVFDREENVESPILSFRVKELLLHINELRKILNPEQIWYFYKRKVLRAIDKSFEIEFNYNRTEEFIEIINRRFTAKREQILQNFRNLKLSESDDLKFIKWLNRSSSQEIIESQFYWGLSERHLSLINNRLIELYLSNEPFLVMNTLFPEEYFAFNANFHANSLSFLLQLSDRINKINHCPSWLKDATKDHSNEIYIDEVIKILIHHNLTHFQDDRLRQTILLLSSSLLRVSKIMSVILPISKITAKHSHALQRFYDEELSWRQITSTMESHLISNYTINARLAFIKFIESVLGRNNHHFKLATAQQGLIDLWKMEIGLLESVPNYIGLEKELELGEIWEPRYTVTFDYLAHYTICLLLDNYKWKKYIIETYPNELNLLNAMNSWAIQKLEFQTSELSESAKDTLIAQRLFLGHEDIYQQLKNLYNRENNS